MHVCVFEKVKIKLFVYVLQRTREVGSNWEVGSGKKKQPRKIRPRRMKMKVYLG